MVVGKTSSSISITEVFSKISEVQLLSTVFPEITKLPCIINSPLRIDNHPSFSIYLDNNNHVRYKDYANSTICGGIIDLLCEYWNCSFSQTLHKICNMMLQDNKISIKPKQIKTVLRHEANLLTKIQVTVRPWRNYDYKYWEAYGITPKWLRYAEIYPISYKIITKKESLTDKGNKFIFPANKYSYVYIERKEGEVQLKIYSPFNSKYKWCSKMDASVISLWTKVPEYGDKLIIASSTKDALCISCNLHLPAIAPQGEGYHLSNTAITELKRRFKEIYISFDGDNAGKIDAKKLSETTGFKIIPCPILNTPDDNNEAVKALIKEGFSKNNKAKDWSDIYLYFGKDRFIEEFNKAVSIT